MSDIQEHMRWLRDAGGRANMEALRAIEALLARAEAAESERDRLKKFQSIPKGGACPSCKRPIKFTEAK